MEQPSSGPAPVITTQDEVENGEHALPTSSHPFKSLTTASPESALPGENSPSCSEGGREILVMG